MISMTTWNTDLLSSVALLKLPYKVFSPVAIPMPTKPNRE
jgi:hypothetical protein